VHYSPCHDGGLVDGGDMIVGIVDRWVGEDVLWAVLREGRSGDKGKER
jgi:hypothetical protein